MSTVQCSTHPVFIKSSILFLLIYNQSPKTKMGCFIMQMFTITGFLKILIQSSFDIFSKCSEWSFDNDYAIFSFFFKTCVVLRHRFFEVWRAILDESRHTVFSQMLGQGKQRSSCLQMDASWWSRAGILWPAGCSTYVTPTGFFHLHCFPLLLIHNNLNK